MNELIKKLDQNNIPNHVAIILDGNGRWAKKRGLPRIMGHLKGIETLSNLVKFSKEIGIKNLTVYAFSTENINRPKDEVDFLMNEFLKFFQNKYQKLLKMNINVRVIGEVTNLNNEIIKAINEINQTKINPNNMTFTICFNYGSQQEIIYTIKEIAKKVKNSEIDIDQINSDLINQNLYTSNLLPLDLIIRTSGEYRLSNFLLWQASYSEFYFTNTYFPDFDNEELLRAIIDYQSRERRFGKIGEKK